MKREYELEQKAGEIAQVAIIESSAIGVPNDHIEPWVKDFAIGVAVATAKWADSHPAWVSVEDELPKERGKLYLVCDKYGRVGESAYDVEDDIWYRQSGMLLNPTHWMPLPTPPVKKGGQDAS